MRKAERAARQLATMMNDIEAHSLFSKNSPLGWFALHRTYTSAYRKGTLTEKQITLIISVYEEYKILKSASGQFATTDQPRKIASVLYRVLQEKPKVTSKEERSRSQRLSRIVAVFRGGAIVHIGHFNDAESLIGELPIKNKVTLWEQIHSSRRAYLAALYEIN